MQDRPVRFIVHHNSEYCDGGHLLLLQDGLYLYLYPRYSMRIPKYSSNPNSYVGEVLHPLTDRWRYISVHCLQTSERDSPSCPSDKSSINVNSTCSTQLSLHKNRNTQKNLSLYLLSTRTQTCTSYWQDRDQPRNYASSWKAKICIRCKVSARTAQ